MGSKITKYQFLYDAECPVCRMATRSLLKSDHLQERNLQSYQSASGQVCQFIDRQRAANEMAVINLENNEVSYGAGAILAALAEAYPVLSSLFKSKLFIVLATFLYKLFSFNRRVIVPTPSATQFSIQPEFNLPYRLIWIFITWLVSGFILEQYALLLAGHLGIPGIGYLIIAGQLLVHALVIYLLNKRKLWEYLGKQMTVSLLGSIFLLPALLLDLFVQLPAVIYACWAFMVGCFMIWRMRSLIS